MDLPRHPVDAEAVDPVRADLELEDRLGERQHLGQRAAWHGLAVQDRDPVRIVADLKLGLREDHSVGGDAPELGAVELLPSGQHRAGERHRDGLPGGDVGRAADDRARRAAGLHLAHGQPLGVGVPRHGDDLADHEAIGRWRADVGDPLELRRPQREQLAQLVDGQAGIAVLAEPQVRHPHRNCSSTRTSFSKNLRRSGTPCLSIAIRSIPIPNAKPWTRSAS